MQWKIYLSGEIHSDWRDQIIEGCDDLNIQFLSAVTDHDASDAAGDVLGEQTQPFWRDHQSAKVNAIRIQTMIRRADIAVIRFGDKYREWNAALDASNCVAASIPQKSLRATADARPAIVSLRYPHVGSRLVEATTELQAQ